jgi:predicted aspartyl protease
MIDSGATSLFINHQFITQHKIPTHRLEKSILLLNINGSKNNNGAVTQFTCLMLTSGRYSEMLEFLVTDLGPEDVILGLPWLKKVGAQVDFKGGNMTVESGEQPTAVDKSEPHFQRIAANCVQQRQWMKQGLLEHDSNELWVAAGYTHSTRLAAKANLAKKAKTIEEMIPVEYQRYSKVFSEIESKCLPDHNTWNYLTYFGSKHQSKHLAKHLRYLARYFSSKYLR